MSCSCGDIHTCHVTLIHPAADIQFNLAYLNGLLSAQITDINQRNVQAVLEKYFSLHGIPVKHEIPIGSKNRVNVSYRTQFEFVVNSLEVILSGITLNGNQLDPNRDFDVHLDNQGFTLLLSPSSASSLNKPPRQDEPLFVNYGKRITFNTHGGT